MAQYGINKGVGKPVELFGLKSQYLFLFAGGLLGDFFLFVVLYLIGINQFVCIAIGIIVAGLVTWGTFALNKKYGEFGLMKFFAKRSHPHFIISRRRFNRLLNTLKQNKHAQHAQSSNTGK